MIFILFTILISFAESSPTTNGIPDEFKVIIVDKVNQIRLKGCRCGSKKMRPVGPVIWNETLFRSAMSHAKDMDRNNFFDHYSSLGENVGERLDGFGYNWVHIGENIGTGQKTFSEVLDDWIKSPSHCEMLMNPNVKEMGVARYRSYWVQHFGTQVPKGYVRNK